MSIFLSYRRLDSELVVGPMYDRLVAHFSVERVFRDLDSLPIGRPFPQVLTEALSRSEVALIIIGPNWTSITDSQGKRRLDDPRDFVRLEVEKSLKAGFPVIPVLINRASMPKADELPKSLRPLVFHNGVQIRPDPDFHRDMDRLITKLAALVSSRSEKQASLNATVPVNQGSATPNIIINRESVDFLVRHGTHVNSSKAARLAKLARRIRSSSEKAGYVVKRYDLHFEIVDARFFYTMISDLISNEIIDIVAQEFELAGLSPPEWRPVRTPYSHGMGGGNVLIDLGNELLEEDG
jgi:hypothetical protein